MSLELVLANAEGLNASDRRGSGRRPSRDWQGLSCPTPASNSSSTTNSPSSASANKPDENGHGVRPTEITQERLISRTAPISNGPCRDNRQMANPPRPVTRRPPPRLSKGRRPWSAGQHGVLSRRRRHALLRRRAAGGRGALVSPQGVGSVPRPVAVQALREGVPKRQAVTANNAGGGASGSVLVTWRDAQMSRSGRVCVFRFGRPMHMASWPWFATVVEVLAFGVIRGVGCTRG